MIILTCKEFRNYKKNVTLGRWYIWKANLLFMDATCKGFVSHIAAFKRCVAWRRENFSQIGKSTSKDETFSVCAAQTLLNESQSHKRRVKQQQTEGEEGHIQLWFLIFPCSLCCHSKRASAFRSQCLIKHLEDNHKRRTASANAQRLFKQAGGDFFLHKTRPGET